MVWVFLGFLIFLILIIFAGIRHYREIPIELVDMAKGLSINLERKGVFSRYEGAVAPVRYGPCYSATYRDLPTVVANVLDKEGRIIGTAFSLRFIHSLAFALFCNFNSDTFTTTMVTDEYRDFYLSRVDISIAGLKGWTSDRDKAMMVLRGDGFACLVCLADHIERINNNGLPGLPQAGFMINEQEVTLLVSRPVMLDRELIEEAYHLCQILSVYGFGKSGESIVAEKHGLKMWVLILLVLFMGFIIGAMIMGLLKWEVSTLWSIWIFD